MLSFNNDEIIKQNIIQNLRFQAEQPDVWQKNSVVWNGSAGSVVGHIIHSEDLTDWENLGLPKWLAVTLDHFFIATPDLEKGIQSCIDLIEGIPVGSNLNALGSLYLIELLIGSELGLNRLSATQSVTDAIQATVNLHQQCLQSETVPVSKWRNLRKALIEVSNVLDDSTDRRIGACIEAAAWDPISSRTVVADSLYYWNLAKSKAVYPDDYTAQDEIRVQQLLKQLYDEAKAKQSSDEFIDVLALFDDNYPQEATRFKHFIQWQNEQPVLFRNHAIDLLKNMFLNAQ